MVPRLSLAVAIAAGLLAQVGPIPTLALSPQGAQTLLDSTGRRISGFQLIGITVEAPTPTSCSGADVMTAAIAAGFSVRGENETRLNLSRAAAGNWRNRSVIGLTLVTGALGIASGAGIGPKFSSESAGHAFTAGLSGFSLLVASTLPILKSSAPDPSPLIGDLISAKVSYKTPFSGLLGAGFPSKVGAVVIPLRCNP